jgi:putative flippase GtrA
MLVVAIVAILMRELLLHQMPLRLAEATAHAVGIGAGAVLNYNGHRLLTFHRNLGGPDIPGFLKERR